MRTVIWALAAVLCLVPPSGAAPTCGTIDRTGATIEAGTAPTAGTVTVDACLEGGTPPALPVIDPMGTIGPMTGSMPAFPGGGTGTEGAFHATTNMTLGGGTYNFTTYEIDNTFTVEYSGAVTILTTGNMKIYGVLRTTGAGSSITIRCGGDFDILGGPAGVAKVWAPGVDTSIELMVDGKITGGGRADLYAPDGELSVTAHAPVGSGPAIFLDGTGMNCDGDLTIRALAGVLFDPADINCENASLLVQSFEDAVTLDGNTDLTVQYGPSLRVEAATRTHVDGGYVSIRENGTLTLASYGGDLLLDDSCDVSTQYGDLSAIAFGTVNVVDGAQLESSEDGNVLVRAYAGDVRVGIREGGPPDRGYLDSDSGKVSLVASRSVYVGGSAEVNSRSGAVEVRAIDGDFELSHEAELGSEFGAVGAIDVRASRSIQSVDIDEALIRGASVSLSAGSGGVSLDLFEFKVESGDLSILTSGPLVLRDTIEAFGDIFVSTTDPRVDTASARLTTLARIGAPSGGITVETWGGAAGSIDATNSTIRSGTSDTVSGDVTLTVRSQPAGPGPDPVESFFLPKRVLVKLNAKKPEKSKLVTSGFFDLGPDAVDLGTPGTLTVGGVVVAVPGLTLSGTKYVYKGSDGTTFSVKKHKTGSSRAKFKLTLKQDLTGKVDPDAVLTMRFQNDAIDGKGSVELTRGKYSYKKVRGTLVTPDLYLAKSKAKLKGAGKDSLSVLIGLATDGKTPAAASDVTIEFAGTKYVIAASEFTRTGDRFEYRGAAGGITLCQLDYAKEQMKVKGKGLDLGAFSEGPQAVLVVLSVGTNERAVRVRMVKKGKSLRY